LNNNLKYMAQQCACALKEAHKIVLLSGAGMSTNAGIPDFRGPNGIYKQKMQTDPELIFDIDYFQKNPRFFYQFHREFLKVINKIEPTFSHRFFAQLEKEGKLAGIITQNIDALHQKAGSKKVYEIHGSTWQSYCTSCSEVFDYETSYAQSFKEDVPHCEKCGGVLKPDIVFFGENVKHLYECQTLAEEADLLFVVGSSLTVTPAAFLPSMCPGKIVVVNKGDISYAYLHPQKIFIHAEWDIDDFFKAVEEAGRE